MSISYFLTLKANFAKRVFGGTFGARSRRSKHRLESRGAATGSFGEGTFGAAPHPSKGRHLPIVKMFTCAHPTAPHGLGPYAFHYVRVQELAIFCCNL